jgi:hypothetical protein
MSPLGRSADMCLIEVRRWKILIKNEAGDGKNTTHYGVCTKIKPPPGGSGLKFYFN